MATTQGNRTSFAYGVEPSPSGDPTVTYYLGVNPGSISTGPDPERIAHDPIGPSPMQEQGTVIRTMAPFAFELDLVRDHWIAFLEGALRCSMSTTPRIFYPTSVRSTDYVVAANGALAEGTLIIVRGCATAANNGLKVVGAGSDGTHIVASGLTAETFSSGQGVTVEVCGFQFATGDAEIDASGNLKTTTKDLTDLGIPAGQTIWIGGDGSGVKFATAAHRGQARVSIAPTANLLTLDSKSSGVLPASAADNGSGKTIQLFYGRTARVSSTTAAAYVERTYQLEVGHGTLSAGSAAYERTLGCALASYRLALPTGGKGTIAVSFNGASTTDPSASRATAFSAPLQRNALGLMNTADHVRRERIRQSTTDLTGYITSSDITITTGAQRNEAHGAQGNVLTTYGDIKIAVSAQAFFSTMELVPALLSDTLCNADWFLRCGGSSASSTDTWGFALDMPAVQIDKAPRTYDPERPTSVAVQFHPVRDTTYNTILIVSDFPYLPAP